MKGRECDFVLRVRSKGQGSQGERGDVILRRGLVMKRKGARGKGAGMNKEWKVRLRVRGKT